MQIYYERIGGLVPRALKFAATSETLMVYAVVQGATPRLEPNPPTDSTEQGRRAATVCDVECGCNPPVRVKANPDQWIVVDTILGA
jgi:hypothetical protein